MSTDVPRKRAHGAARVRRVPGTSVSARDGRSGIARGAATNWWRMAVLAEARRLRSSVTVTSLADALGLRGLRVGHPHRHQGLRRTAASRLAGAAS